MTGLPPTSVRRKTRWAIYLLFLLASIHCARSAFVVNVSLLDLSGYEQGTERMPFQGRIAMMPILRWAHGNRMVAKAAAFFDASLLNTPHFQQPPEHYTPEKLVCMVLGVLSVVAMTFAAVWFGRRHLGELWWLPGVLTLAMLYVTYSARYEMQFWYPYDLPHFAIFGIAAMLLLEDMWIPALLLFWVDAPLRETSIYLVGLTIVMGRARGTIRKAIGISGAMLLVWLPIRIWVMHLYAHNPDDTGFHDTSLLRAIVNPLHWPQIASAFGFLAVPIYLGRKYLPRDQRYFAVAALPCLAVTLFFGIWYETRIFNEWILPAAILLSTEAMGWIRATLPLPAVTRPAAESL